VLRPKCWSGKNSIFSRWAKLHVAHPEACFEVCQKADYIGSTEVILKIVREAEPNTRWLVATELNLVNRLHDECKAEGKNVHFMSPTLSMCSTMFRTDPAPVFAIARPH
jgi:quinolinate synthase